MSDAAAKRTILLVEDDPKDAELTMRALRRNNIANEIVLVEDGAEAIDYLMATGRFADRDVTDQPAVVLLDLKLPKIDGLEVLARVRADPRTRRTPVVLLTSSREERDVVAAYDRGANSYVRKPIDFAELVEAVKGLGMYWLLINDPPPRPRS